MEFEQKFKDLINTIDGNKENILLYDSFSDSWCVEAINRSPCPLGEVNGQIEARGNNLDELLTVLKIEIAKYNKDKQS